MSEKRMLRPGSMLGRNRVESLVGSRQNAEVYRARHPDFKQDIALKVLNPNIPQNDAIIARFRQEAQAIVNLKHPNIIRMHEFDLSGGLYYQVMEFIEGSSLRDLISAHPTGVAREDLLRIFNQIASAIAYSHEQQVMHGNIKPDNVLLDANLRPVLTDFRVPCLSQFMQAQAGDNPAYLAPEQATQGTLDIPVDIYQLGILLYEMATGEVPFDAGNRTATINQHLSQPPRPPSELNVNLDPRIERVILKALNKKPADRYASAREMLGDIERQEATSLYETVSLNRKAAEEVRKRRSEIVRFEQSRADLPAFDDDVSGLALPDAAREIPLAVIIAGIIVLVAIIITVILLML
ncbi:MAG: serine/threonine protein kinase [Chloroflexi bacterium]|nr:serine/threonine protein kinase [Chloroflexota bacterium]